MGYCLPIFDYLRQRQIDLTPVLASLGITEPDLRDPDCRVENARLSQTMQLCAELCEDENIGLHCSEAMQIQHLGLVGILVMCCSSTREVFELHSRYGALVGNGLHTRYVEQGEELCMEVTVPEGHFPLHRHDYEFSLGGWLRLFMQLVGEPSAPLRIELPYPAPDDDSEIRSLVKAPISYGHAQARVYFPERFAHLPLMAADPALKQTLEAQARKRLQELRGELVESDPQLTEIRRRIAEKLAYGVPTIEQIAEDMQVAVRTLQRQLDNRSSSYSQLLEQVRAEMAKQAMSKPELSLVDVALMLGFAEQSSFARAFKRWFGMSPGAWRKHARETGELALSAL